MKVLAFNGSPRNEGNTTMLVNHGSSECDLSNDYSCRQILAYSCGLPEEQFLKGIEIGV